MAKEKEKSGGSPKWMATFADMCTLLLTFFVIMLSMANIDIEKFREMLGSVKEAFGVQLKQRGEYQAAIDEEILTAKFKPKKGKSRPPDEMSRNGYDHPTGAQNVVSSEEAAEKREQRLAVAEIRAAINQTELGDMTEIQSGSKGIRIRVKGALLFAPGQAELKAQAKPFMDNLVLVLEKFDYFLLVEGHTDSIPIATKRFPSNWELSGHRASAVLRYLISSGIDPKRLTSVGLADNYPLAGNDTAAGRTRNRRVEFVLTKQPFRPEIN